MHLKKRMTGIFVQMSEDAAVIDVLTVRSAKASCKCSLPALSPPLYLNSTICKVEVVEEK